MTVWDKLFSFKGRLGRRDWFVWGAVVCGVQMVVVSTTAIAWGMLPLPPWTILPPFVVSLPCLWPYAALSAKRMQDTGRSAAPLLWYLAGALAFMVAIVVGMVTGHFPPLIAFLPVALFPLAAYCVIIIVFVRGSVASNRVGQASPFLPRPLSPKQNHRIDSGAGLPMNGQINWAELFFSSNGRLARTPFVIAALALIVVAALYDAVIPGPLHWLTGWFVYPALLWSGACLLAKRLHDRGRSGWITFPIIISLIAVWPYPDALFDFLFMLVVLWAIIELGVMGGEPGANRYGPSPLRPLST